MDRARRHFLSALSACLPCAWAAPAAAPKPARVLWFHDFSPRRVAEHQERIRAGFASHRLVDGRDIALTLRPNEGARMDEVVASRPDAIVMTSYKLLELAKLTRDIPVVFFNMSMDPVATGLVQSLQRPGRNFTGTVVEWDLISTKCWQLLKDVRPSMRRGAVLGPEEFHLPELPDPLATRRRAWRAAAENLRIEIREIVVPERAPASAVAAAVRDAGAEALEVEIETTPELMAHFSRASIPTAGFSFGRVRSGRLMLGVSFDWTEGENQAIAMVARILRGESPATIPVYQTRNYVIAVNLKLAREAGIEIPPSILIQAKETVQ